MKSDKYSYKGHTIDPMTARITMIFFGAVLILLSFGLNDIVIAINKVSITHLFIGAILIISALLSFYIRVGIKRIHSINSISSFKKFSPAQMTSTTISIIVLVSGILNLFGYNILTLWNIGTMFFSGLTIIYEALK